MLNLNFADFSGLIRFGSESLDDCHPLSFDSTVFDCHFLRFSSVSFSNSFFNCLIPFYRRSFPKWLNESFDLKRLLTRISPSLDDQTLDLEFITSSEPTHSRRAKVLKQRFLELKELHQSTLKTQTLIQKRFFFFLVLGSKFFQNCLVLSEVLRTELWMPSTRRDFHSKKFLSKRFALVGLRFEQFEIELQNFRLVEFDFKLFKSKFEEFELTFQFHIFWFETTSNQNFTLIRV